MERRREVAETLVRAALGGLRSTQPHPSTERDFRKLPRPFVPRRVRSSDRLGLRRENYTCAVLKSRPSLGVRVVEESLCHWRAPVALTGEGTVKTEEPRSRRVLLDI